VLDELKLRYKELELIKRLGICAMIALIPGVYIYFNDAVDVDAQFAEAEVQEKEAADKLLTAENQLKNFQKTQSELEFTKEQLKKAEERLPASVAIDEVLRDVGKISKEMSVNVRLFEPQAEVIRGDDYKYSEVPISISVEAKEYSQICEWIDRVAGGKSRIYIKSWTLGRRQAKSELEVQKSADKINSSDPLILAEQKGTAARDRLRVVLEGQFSLYKMASAEQLAANINPEKINSNQPRRENEKVTDPSKSVNPTEVEPAEASKTQASSNGASHSAMEGVL
jgi:Tfp pilus assembly protein PilO